MKITRYNRSFIGLMEMDNEGEWCKYNEALEQNQELGEYAERMRKGYVEFMKSTRIQTKKAYFFWDLRNKLGFFLFLSLMFNLYEVFK